MLNHQLVTNPDKRHGIAGCTPTGEQLATRVAFGNALVELGCRNDKIVVLDGDLANSTLVDMFANSHPERFFEMGIAEQNMMGVAAGLAALGFIPFVSTFAAFATSRDLDQVRVVVAQPKLNVKICGAYSGILTGRTGKTHQSIDDLAVFRAMPNMIVLAPGDAVETRQAVSAAAEHSGPVYFRLTRDPSPIIFAEGYRFEIGRGVVLRDGPDVALVSTGVQTALVLQAAEHLAAEGIQAYLLHLPTIKPLDEGAVVQAARHAGCVVTIEEHTIIGGLGGAVAETLSEQFPTLLQRIGLVDEFSESAPNEALLEKHGLTPRQIAAAAKRLIDRKERLLHP